MKKLKEQKLIRNQISRKLAEIGEILKLVNGIDSWSRYLRKALGMSVSQFAQRLGVTQSSASGMEKREVEGTLTINKLRQMADAVECDLVYAFVPRDSLEKIIINQAKKKALRSIELSDTHMALEDQKVKLKMEERIKELIEEKMYSKYLWDKNE